VVERRQVAWQGSWHSTPPTASRMEIAHTMASADRTETLVSLCKRRGFVYPSSEIYGGQRSAWDYGPLGVELKENIKRHWWKAMVQVRNDIVGLDSSVILAREVWEASGHVKEFVDPLTECQSCHKRFRADELEEGYEARHGHPPANGLADIVCPNCGTRGAFTEPRMFNGLMKTYLGAVEDDSGLAYLRPETAQGIFVNFANVLQSSRKKPPFGVAQVGKSFRNEVTPGNFIFRTREFEQMEMEYFVEPGTDEQWHEYWLAERTNWYVDLGIRRENLRHYEVPAEKRAHYSKRTVDIEYRFHFAASEWGELEGVANRTDFDLTTHSKHAGVDLSYFDQEKGERWVPYVVEPAAGIGRPMMAFLLDAYAEDTAPNAKGVPEKRTVMRLDRRLAPVKAAVLPLSRNADLSPKARDLAQELRRCWNVEFDDAGAIGRRYRRQDEIGTPFCVTVDFDTLTDNAVTIRERDSMQQDRVPIDGVRAHLSERLADC
jgi:glycyl-tRNA synthetase